MYPSTPDKWIYCILPISATSKYNGHVVLSKPWWLIMKRLGASLPHPRVLRLLGQGVVAGKPEDSRYKIEPTLDGMLVHHRVICKDSLTVSQCPFIPLSLKRHNEE